MVEFPFRHLSLDAKRTVRHLLFGQLLLLMFACLILISVEQIEARGQTSRPARENRDAKVRPATPGNWLQWGGPQHNFITNSTGIASSWPATGPRKIWDRPLGEGYSGISVEDTTLYTAYHRNSQDVIIAINTTTGKTIWEYAYESPFKTTYPESVGPGPYAMPQVIGDRLVTAGGLGKIHSLDKKTGRPVWSRDIYTEFGGTRLDFGYSCHALPYKNNLIVLAGGEGNAVLSLRQSDGAVVWKSMNFKNAHSSPVLIDVDGQPQVVALMASEVIGLNPENGQLLWQHPHETQYGLAISTPVWMPGNLLFVSSAYEGGSRVLQLHQSGGKTEVKELWYNRRLQSHFGTVIRLGDYLYLSSGHNGPALLTCVNIRSGEVAWQQRGFAKAHLVAADGKLILLDEDGTIALIAPTPKELQVLVKASVLQNVSWTPPTLVGTKLYLRNRLNLMALDLSAK